jgi:hypothetical protein
MHPVSTIPAQRKNRIAKTFFIIDPFYAIISVKLFKERRKTALVVGENPDRDLPYLSKCFVTCQRGPKGEALTIKPIKLI